MPTERSRRIQGDAVVDDIAPDFDAQESAVPRRDAVMAAWVAELVFAAKVESGRALAAHSAGTPDEERQAVIAAGTASEYLHVAAVVSVDPVLLADRRHEDSILMLSAHNAEGALDHSTLRTLGMNECISLVGRLFPTLRVDREARALAALRNSAAHTAHVGQGSASVAMRQLVRVADALLATLPDSTTRNFWPQNYTDAVSQFRADAENEVKQLVATRLAAARDRLETLTESLPDLDAENVMRTLEARVHPVLSTARIVECPACGRGAVLRYSSVVVMTGSPRDHSEEPARVGVPADLDCPVCGLELFGEMITEFPSLAEHIELELDDWTRTYGIPEEDWLADVDGRESADW